jgi:arginyl-tRNA synthetase
MKEHIKQKISGALRVLGIAECDLAINDSDNFSRGDYASNVAMVIMRRTAKEYSVEESGLRLKTDSITVARGEDNSWNSPQELAEKIKGAIELGNGLEKVEVAGPGFLNFFVSRDFLTQQISTINSQGENYGKSEKLAGQKILVEYTDPNPFKQLHIGHLMSNAIGEAISRLIESQGAELRRANYQGDVGLHVAKAIWGMKKNQVEMPGDEATPEEKMTFLGESYRNGAGAYEEGGTSKEEIDALNTQIYTQSNPEVNELYEKGKQWSLDHFETIYKKVGTKFDQYFFESGVAGRGKEIVEKNIGKVFEKSDGAIVFRGEKFGLHTRVFLTSKGLPTYEAKELGLHLKKREWWDADKSVVLTANEQKDVFAVGLKAFGEIDPDAEKKVEHITHGMMLGPDGKKMSSRKGEVISAESLLEDVSKAVEERIADRAFAEGDKKLIAEQVAIGAIKYTILKQTPGKNIVFDMKQAVSFEGDSGPYLQYTAVRARSVLGKARVENITPNITEVPKESFARTIWRGSGTCISRIQSTTLGDIFD